MSGMSIGKASDRSGCTPATIRFYEEEGLLRPIARGANGRRVYGWPDVHRLKFVRRCRDLGFPLEEVRDLLSAVDARAPDCLVVRDLARKQIDVLRVRRQELDALEGSLSALAKTCDTACRTGRSPDCKIIEQLQGAASG
jgi:MerR family copper efflux transcriptional regulator